MRPILRANRSSFRCRHSAVNGLDNPLLNFNPNLNPANGAGATNPFRLDRSQAATNDQDHNYTPEQQAFDGGVMDLFPLYTGVAGPPPRPRRSRC